MYMCIVDSSLSCTHSITHPLGQPHINAFSNTPHVSLVSRVSIAARDDILVCLIPSYFLKLVHSCLNDETLILIS